MLIYEILKRKEFIEKKLIDVENFLVELDSLEIENKASSYNIALEMQFTLLSKLQSHETLLQAQNSNNIITIGNDTLTVYEVVKLQGLLNKKIRTLDRLIAKGDKKVISVFNLMEQRDKLFEEFMLLELLIKKSDLTENWDNKE